MFSPTNSMVPELSENFYGTRSYCWWTQFRCWFLWSKCRWSSWNGPLESLKVRRESWKSEWDEERQWNNCSKKWWFSISQESCQFGLYSCVVSAKRACLTSYRVSVPLINHTLSRSIWYIAAISFSRYSECAAFLLQPNKLNTTSLYSGFFGIGSINSSPTSSSSSCTLCQKQETCIRMHCRSGPPAQAWKPLCVRSTLHPPSPPPEPDPNLSVEPSRSPQHTCGRSS